MTKILDVENLTNSMLRSYKAKVKEFRKIDYVDEIQYILNVDDGFFSFFTHSEKKYHPVFEDEVSVVCKLHKWKREYDNSELKDEVIKTIIRYHLIEALTKKGIHFSTGGKL